MITRILKISEFEKANLRRFRHAEKYLRKSGLKTEENSGGAIITTNLKGQRDDFKKRKSDDEN